MRNFLKESWKRVKGVIETLTVGIMIALLSLPITLGVSIFILVFGENPETRFDNMVEKFEHRRET